MAQPYFSTSFQYSLKDSLQNLLYSVNDKTRKKGSTQPEHWNLRVKPVKIKFHTNKSTYLQNVGCCWYINSSFFRYFIQQFNARKAQWIITSRWDQTERQIYGLQGASIKFLQIQKIKRVLNQKKLNQVQCPALFKKDFLCRRFNKKGASPNTWQFRITSLHLCLQARSQKLKI